MSNSTENTAITNAVIYIGIAGSSISMIATFCVLAAFLAYTFMRPRLISATDRYKPYVFAERMIVWLVFWNFLWSTANFGQNLCSFSLAAIPLAACAVVGPAVMMASEASLYWISTVSLYMCVTIVFGLRINKNFVFSEKSFVLWSILLPLACALIPFATGGYQFNGYWCAVKLDGMNGESYMWVISLFLTSTILVLCFAIILTSLFVRRKPARWVQVQVEEWGRQARGAFRKLVPFPVMFVVQFSCCMLQALLPSPPAWFQIIHTTAFNVSPFILCLLYAQMDRERLREMRVILCRYPLLFRSYVPKVEMAQPLIVEMATDSAPTSFASDEVYY